MRQIQTLLFLLFVGILVIGHAPTANAGPAAESPTAHPQNEIPSDLGGIQVRPLPEESTSDQAPSTHFDEQIAEEESEMLAEDRAAYAEKLRAQVKALRSKVVDTIATKLQKKQGERIGQVAFTLFLFSLSGLLLLFAPLVLHRKYPNKGATLMKHGALAALLFFLAVNLFSGVLLVMRGSQAVLGQVSNPQIQLVEATFDLLSEKAPELAEVGPQLIDPVLDGMSGGSDDPALVLMLENAQQFQEDITVFQSVAHFMRRLNWLFGIMPIILVGVALVVFAQAAKGTLVSIVRLPARAAAGESGVGAAAVRSTLQSVFQEFRATLVVIVALAALTIFGGVMISKILTPTIEVFIGYLTLSLIYLQVVENASSFLVLLSLLTAILFMAFNLVIAIVSSAFFISKTQKIAQARFRDGVAFSAHRRFWKVGTLSAVWCQLLPLLFALLSVHAIGWLATELVETGSWPLIICGGPGLFLLSFGLIFWAGRGLKALRFLRTYDVSRKADPLGNLTPPAHPLEPST